jgi:hypothetical protein
LNKNNLHINGWAEDGNEKEGRPADMIAGLAGRLFARVARRSSRRHKRPEKIDFAKEFP